jgi:hypothetical protein
MADRDPAAELDALLASPALSGRWPDGFTTDDVLGELHALGRVRVAVSDGDQAADGRLTPRYACALELRDDPQGVSVGRGLSLTVAAVRCLLDAEEEIAEAARRALSAFGELLAEG